MTNRKTTRRALVLSLLSLLLCCSMLVGTTFAWFTDSVQSGNNQIIAGNLDIELKYAQTPNGEYETVEGVGDIFVAPAGATKGLWEPGHTEVAYLQIHNAGTLALKYQLQVAPYTETIGKNAENQDIKLSEILKFVATTPSENAMQTAYTRESAQAAALAGNGIKLTQYTTEVLTLAPGVSRYVALVVYMPEEVGNEANYRGEAVPTIEFALNLQATQVEAEFDSFGNDYDEDSMFSTDVATAAELANAMAVGGIVNVTADITVDESLTVPAGVNTMLKLNGKTITGTMHKSNGAVITNNGTLTVTGGTVSSTAANGGSALMNKGAATVTNATLNGAPNADGSWPSYTVNNTGTLTISDSKVTSVHGGLASYNEGAVITMNDTDLEMTGIPGFTSHGLYTYNSGKIVVNGGDIANKATDQNASGASVINGNVEVNSGNFSGRIENYYGTPVLKGGTYTVNPKASFVAEGFEVKDNGNGTWTVTSSINTQAELNAALNDSTKKVVHIAAGTYTTPSIPAGKTIIAEEGTVFEGTLSGTVKDATIKNVEFKGANAQRWAYAGGTLLFENCTFDASSVYAIHYDGLTGANITYKNCVIRGWAAIGSGAEYITFDGCSIYGNGTYGVLRVYSPATIKNCTFDVAAVNTTDVYQDGIHAVDCEVKVSNNKNVNGAMSEIYNVSGTGKITEE